MYANKNDPRLFVYLDNTCKWCGVTLNFAHKISWIIMMVIIMPLIANSILMMFGGETQLVVRRLIIFCAIYFPILITLCYLGAALDLRRHPGRQGPR